MAQARGAKSIDMLEGPIAKKLVMFALPLAAAGILQQLFNSADVAVVGRFDSVDAQAGVGASSPLFSLMVTLFTGVSLGLNVCVASLIGSGEREHIEPAEHTGIMLSFICGAITIVFGELFSPALLRLMSTPDNVLDYATTYLRILFVAIAFQLVYDFAASVLRGSGDSAHPMYVLAIASLINLLLDLLFVGGFGMGVAGAALATVIANAFSAVALLVILMRDTGDIHLDLRRLRIERHYLRAILAIGVPAGLQGAIFCISNMILQAAINAIGAAAIDGNSTASSYEFLAYYLVYAFAQGATTFTSANFSARKPERCRRVYRLSMVLGIGLCLVACVAIVLFREPLVMLFTSDPDVISNAYARIFAVSLFDELTGTYEVPGGCLRGMRHSTIPTVITAIGSCVLRILWVWVIMPLAGLTSFVDIVIIFPISWVGMGIAMNIVYFYVRKREFARMAETATCRS